MPDMPAGALDAAAARLRSRLDHRNPCGNTGPARRPPCVPGEA
jgi:hypothetical protein